MPTINRRRKRASSESDEGVTPPRELRSRSKKVNYAEDSSEDEAKPIRPSRILASNRVKKADVQGFNDNAADSALLRLPAEIRERILKYVLGGNTIHIWTETAEQRENIRKYDRRQIQKFGDDAYNRRGYDWDDVVDDFSDFSDKSDSEGEEEDKYRDDIKSDDERFLYSLEKKSRRFYLRHSICARDDSTDEDDIQQINAETYQVRNSRHHNWEKRHLPCRFSYYKSHMRPMKLDLALLSVCRQIHGEAALLPLQENTFTFRDFGEIQVFLSTLIPSQLHAVQHVNIAYDSWHCDEDAPSIETKLKTSFRSLKTLNIILESDECDWGSHGLRADIFADLMQLKKVKIENVSVQARNTHEFEMQFLEYTLAEFEGWARDLQELLKRDWVGIGKTELEQLRKEARKKLDFSDKWV